MDIGRITHSDVPTCTLRHMKTLRYLNAKTLDIRNEDIGHWTFAVPDSETLPHSDIKTFER